MAVRVLPPRGRLDLSGLQKIARMIQQRKFANRQQELLGGYERGLAAGGVSETMLPEYRQKEALLAGQLPMATGQRVFGEERGGLSLEDRLAIIEAKKKAALEKEAAKARVKKKLNEEIYFNPKTGTSTSNKKIALKKDMKTTNPPWTRMKKSELINVLQNRYRTLSIEYSKTFNPKVKRQMDDTRLEIDRLLGQGETRRINLQIMQGGMLSPGGLQLEPGIETPTKKPWED